jgi:hypothetical protein
VSREEIPLPPETVRYCLMVPGDPHPVETYERDAEGFGAIVAVNRAQALSRNGAGACSVFIGTRFLVAYEHGRRVANDG